MKIQALVLGALFGFLVAIAPSCSGTGTCGAQNCDGCCKSDGTCVKKVSSNAAATCGTAGQACVDCTATGALCNGTTYTCVGGTGGSGGAAGAAGGSAGGGSGGGSGDAGLPTTCDVTVQDCPSGASCMLTNASTGAASCFAGVCDVVLQNCTDTSKRCDYIAAAGGAAVRACVATGTVPEGATCTPGSATAACGKGDICVGHRLADAGATYDCTKFCYQDTDCTGGKTCSGYLPLNPSGGEKPMICVQLTSCDPLTQNCPTGTDGCYLTNTGSGLCVPQGSLAVGDACTPQTLCVKGAMCITGQIDGGSGQFCRSFCNLDGGAPNCSGTAGGSCQALSAALGACVN
jgi:hypothetical protein